MEQILFTKPVIAKIIAMVRGDDDRRIVQLAAVTKLFEQQPHLVINLLDQPHIGAKGALPHRILFEGGADDILRKRGIDRVRIGKLVLMSGHRQEAVRPIHVVIGRRHDIGPVRLDIAEMTHPGPLAFRRTILKEADHLAGQPRSLGIFLTDVCRLAGIRVDPTRSNVAIIVYSGIGIVMPWVFSLIALLAEIGVVGRWLVVIIAIRAGTPQPIITHKHIETAFGQPRADDAVRSKTKPFHSASIHLHMGLADEKRIHPGLAKMIPHRPFADAQRNAVPGGTVRADIPAGIEGHA